jgi:hypothetical protein
VRIANQGDTVVRAPHLTLTLPALFGISQYGVDGNRKHGMPQLARAPEDRNAQFGGSTVVIYPGNFLDVTKVEYEGNPQAMPKYVEIAFVLAADGVERVSDTMRVDF